MPITNEPKTKNGVVATTKGWVDKKTGELLVSCKGLVDKIKSLESVKKPSKTKTKKSSGVTKQPEEKQTMADLAIKAEQVMALSTTDNTDTKKSNTYSKQDNSTFDTDSDSSYSSGYSSSSSSSFD